MLAPSNASIAMLSHQKPDLIRLCSCTQAVFHNQKVPFSSPNSKVFPQSSFRFISSPPHPTECPLHFLLNGSISSLFVFSRTVSFHWDYKCFWSTIFFCIYSIILIVPGKIVTTQRAVNVINTSQEYKFGIGELLSHSLNSNRNPQNLNALNFQLFMIRRLVLKWEPLIT